MGMIALRLTLLFCSLTLCNLGESASVLDNSSDLLKNWLLKEDEEPPSQQSPPLSRRITPKSIFIVPVFNNCPQGHKSNEKGECLKTVPVNEDPNMGVLLQKLKAFFPSPATGTKNVSPVRDSPAAGGAPSNADWTKNAEYGNKNADSAFGPLQLSIPISSKNASEMGQEQGATTQNQAATTSKNAISTGSATAATTETEFTTSDYNSDGSTVGLLDITASTVLPEGYTSETSTELAETTTIVDTVSPELVVTEIPPRSPSSGNGVRNTPNTGGGRTTVVVRRDETTTVDTVYPLPGGDILKTPVKFPDSFGSPRPKTETPAEGGVRIGGSEFTNAYAKDMYNREMSPKNGYSNGANRGGTRTNNNSDNSDSNVSYSSASISSNSENSDSSSSSSSITNFKGDKYQKLPTGGREGTKPKCDPASGYDCAGSKLDAFLPEKRPPYSLYRNPMTTYIRFPGSYPKIRFPEGRKPSSGGDIDDVISYAETNVAGTRYWDSNRYPASYWTSWDSSKPHLVQIWPGDSLVAYNAAHMNNNNNNYNSRSQPISYS